MQLLPEYREDIPRVERFNFVARLTHWSHTVTFLLCLFTGLVLFLDSVDWLAAIFGGYAGAGLVHRISAVIKTLSIIFFLVFDFKGIINCVKDIPRFWIKEIKILLFIPF